MSASSAKAVARVVADVIAGDYRQPDGLKGRIGQIAAESVTAPVVVDATGIYESITAEERAIHLYEDHPCVAPPWTESAICYRNEFGNIIVMHAAAIEESAPLWEHASPLDGTLKWVISVSFFIGGRSGDTLFETTGPAHWVGVAVYDDGRPADIHWRHLVPKYPRENWDTAMLVLLGSLNFLNATNVEVVEADCTPRERRRIARTGVKVHTINVFPPGRRRAPGDKGTPIGATAASPVRGHFAHYGEKYGRGLLFGKYEGKFWIPSRVDVPDATYRLNP